MTLKRRPKGSIKGIHPCPTCGKLYNNLTGHQKFCSLECRPVTCKNCLECGTLFKAKKKSEKFCSTTCSKTFSKRLILEKNKNSSAEGLVTCQICGAHYKTLNIHLNRVHGITSKEYVAKFNAPVICESTSKKLSDNASGENNPWFNHGGKLSPFSKNNKQLDGLSDEVKNEAVANNVERWIKSTPKDQRPMNVEYWVKRGYSAEEAELLVSKHQSTFSLEKCIQRYGEEQGIARWNERQAKWLKNFKKNNYSKVSQKLFKELLLRDPTLDDSIFANRFSDDKNDEVTIKTKTRSIKPDFYNQRLRAVIEFDGHYWHNKGNAEENTEHEVARDAALCEMGLQVFHVKEKHFTKSPDVVINECLEFLARCEVENG